MNHYNLYNSLGLDPQASSEELAEKIQQRIAAGDTSNPGGAEELNLAREILGSPEKRSMYDRRLADTAGTPMNVDSLRSLAARQVGQQPQAAPQQQTASQQQATFQQPQTAPQQPQAAPQQTFGDTAATAEPGGTFSGEKSKKWIPIAIAAVAAIGLIALAATFFTRSGGGFGSGSPAAMTEEVIELLPSQRADWAAEHAAPGHKDEVSEAIEGILSGYEDVEYSVGETYEVKELADEAYGAESKISQQLAQVYEASNIEKAEMVGVNFKMDSGTDQSAMKNAYLFLYGLTDGNWQLYAVTAE